MLVGNGLLVDRIIGPNDLGRLYILHTSAVVAQSLLSLILYDLHIREQGI